MAWHRNIMESTWSPRATRQMADVVGDATLSAQGAQHPTIKRRIRSPGLLHTTRCRVFGSREGACELGHTAHCERPGLSRSCRYGTNRVPAVSAG